jgi:hypothetical protein
VEGLPDMPEPLEVCAREERVPSPKSKAAAAEADKVVFMKQHHGKCAEIHQGTP